MPLKLYQRAEVGAGIPQELLDEFRRYLTTNDPGTRFGRDEPFEWTLEAINSGVRHVHLLDPLLWVEHSRKRRQFDRTSDDLLVYCHAETDRTKVLVVDLASPNGHAKARSRHQMAAWIAAAEQFHRMIRRMQAEQ